MSTSKETSQQAESQQSANPFPLRVRIAQIFFVILGVVLTILLAIWQYDRWQSTNGTFQNLGYAIQWPIFGAFLVIAYRKYIQYERERLEGDDQAAVKKAPEGQMTEVPEDFLGDNANLADRTAAVEDIFADDRRRESRAASLPPHLKQTREPKQHDNHVQSQHDDKGTK